VGGRGISPFLTRLDRAGTCFPSLWTGLAGQLPWRLKAHDW